MDKLYLFIDGINHEGYYSPCYSDNNCLSSFPFPRISNKITYLSSNGTALDLLTSMPIKKKFSRLHRYWILWWGKIGKNAFFATVCCFNYIARWMDTVVKSAGIYIYNRFHASLHRETMDLTDLWKSEVSSAVSLFLHHVYLYLTFYYSSLRFAVLLNHESFLTARFLPKFSTGTLCCNSLIYSRFVPLQMKMI